MPPIPEEQVSPELVLVDPELRERLLRQSLRELLLAGIGPDPHPPRVVPPMPAWDPQPERTSGEIPIRVPVSTPFLVPGRGPARRAHGSSVVAATLIALFFLALPSLAFLPPRQAPTLALEAEPASPGEPTIITWQSDPMADYYVFELSGGGRLVQLETVQNASVTVAASLPPGRYSWQVLVGEGPVRDHDTHGPVAGGTLTID